MTIDWDGTARLVRLSDIVPAGYTDAVTGIAFSPNGHVLATAGGDHTVHLSDVSDPYRPHELATFTNGADPVYGVVFSPDGRILATADVHDSSRVWDVSDARHPRELTRLTNHTNMISSVAFSPDGQTLATASADHTIRLRDTDIERVATHICDIATPPITRTEWNRHLPGLDYKPPCPMTRER